MADPRATLAALEAPFQAVDHANTDLMAARFTGDRFHDGHNGERTEEI